MPIINDGLIYIITNLDWCTSTIGLIQLHLFCMFALFIVHQDSDRVVFFPFSSMVHYQGMSSTCIVCYSP